MNSSDRKSRAKRLHVLTLTPFYPSSSDEANGCFIAEPLSWLEKNDVTVTIFAVQPAYRAMRKGTDHAPRAEWFSYFAPPGNLGLSASGAFVYARVLSAVRRLHLAEPVDLIHAHAPLPCGHAAALLSRELGIPFVVSVHGLDVFSSAKAGDCAGRWNRRIAEMVYRSAHRAICVSQHVCDEIRAGMKGYGRTCVVYNGVDPDLFSPASDGVAPDATILSVGNLIPSKGHELLLRAVAALRRTTASLSCVIIGDGPERQRLGQVARDLEIPDRIIFAGRQSRSSVAEILRRSTVFCLPSHYEGLGCVYLEAMSEGKAAIGCRGQGIEEVIEHDVNGCLVNPGNLDELVATLAELLQNEGFRKRIGNAARHTVLRGLTLSHQAQRLSQIYRECVA